MDRAFHPPNKILRRFCIIVKSAIISIFCRALGLLASKLSSDGSKVEGNSPEEKGLSPVLVELIGSLQQLLSNGVATHKMGACLIIAGWAGCPRDYFLSSLTTLLTQQNGYEELSPFILALQKDCHVRNCQFSFICFLVAIIV